jgi:catechol 2,3-dioxygenase-like lactoylglutathione lyase family enzyme
MTRATIDSVSPFFIAGDIERSVTFYRDKLGFTLVFQEIEPPSNTPFFAIVSRDNVLKDPDGYVLFFGRPAAVGRQPESASYV